MKRIFFFMTFLIGVVGSAKSFAQEAYGRDGRIVSDATALSLEVIPVTENWRVVTINPDKYSPQSRAIGWYIDGITGKEVSLPGARDAIFWFGNILGRQNLTKNIVNLPLTYKWEITENFFGSHGEKPIKEEDKEFSPFSRQGGNVAVIRYNEKASGAAQFNPVYLIPDNWATLVVPAFKFQQANKAIFNETKVVSNAKLLTALLDDANPFNAIAAARLLAPQRGLDVSFIRDTLAKSKDYTQAVFTYLAFKNAHAIRQDAIDDALGKVIDKAATSATLKWIALGITTAKNDDGQSYFTLKDRVKALLLKVDARQKALSTKTDDDAYVNELLVSAQVRTEPTQALPTSTPTK